MPADSPFELDSHWQRTVRSRVLKWYDRHGRKLPWRESADPYRIWISEIMLQQTTVAAVVPYFSRFLDRFPTVHELAQADEADVLRMWEGLGYYSRARNLHRAAREIVHERTGTFPKDAEELRQLPGIGPYTAGAVSSFAFNQPAGILEANTIRLFARLVEFDADPRSSRGQKLLWQFAEWIVAPKRPADFNQAVMDIGSEVCRPVEPDCASCPLKGSCRTFASGRQAEIPLPKQKVSMTEVTEVSVAIRKKGRYLLRQRTSDERWAGLWDFVRFEIPDELADRLPGPDTHDNQPTLFADDDRPELPAVLVAELQEKTGLLVTLDRSVAELRHTVTRFRIRLLCVLCDYENGQLRRGAGYQWYSAAQLKELPLSTTGRTFARRLQE